MTDRIHSFTVVLKDDLRVDDAESLLNVVRHLRGVIKVSPNVREADYFVAEQRVRLDLEQKLWDVLHPKTK